MQPAECIGLCSLNKCSYLYIILYLVLKPVVKSLIRIIEKLQTHTGFVLNSANLGQNIQGQFIINPELKYTSKKIQGHKIKRMKKNLRTMYHVGTHISYKTFY